MVSVEGLLDRCILWLADEVSIEGVTIAAEAPMFTLYAKSMLTNTAAMTITVASWDLFILFTGELCRSAVSL